MRGRAWEDKDSKQPQTQTEMRAPSLGRPLGPDSPAVKLAPTIENTNETTVKSLSFIGKG